jgi:Adenylate and Guanylate cyclase catalytic domain
MWPGQPQGFRFCGACGAALTTASVSEERKVVTVLFADLVGFTSRSGRMDVEDVRGTLAPYHELLRRELERHGGTVEKFIGDAVMALFGAPVAPEDDAERAVRAALSIKDAVAKLRDRDGIDLHVRVGVTTGEALVPLGADPRRGKGWRRATLSTPLHGFSRRRRWTACSSMSARIGRPIRALRFETVEAVVAKGKGEPVAVWRAIEARSLVPEQTRVDDLPLVGRGDEVALLVGRCGGRSVSPRRSL